MKAKNPILYLTKRGTREYIQIFLERFRYKRWNYVTACGFTAFRASDQKQLKALAIDCLKNSSVAVLNMKHENTTIAAMAEERVKADVEPVIQCEVIEIKDKR